MAEAEIGGKCRPTTGAQVQQASMELSTLHIHAPHRAMAGKITVTSMYSNRYSFANPLLSIFPGETGSAGSKEKVRTNPAQ
jgi:hypothetical protein